jgi:hypothetical protein
MADCAIIQPGRTGDIIICLPIARYKKLQGYTVFWPVHRDYLSMMDYVDYVNSLPVDGPVGNSRQKAIDLIRRQIYKKTEVYDIAIGFKGHPLNREWYKTGLSFDQWKYQQCNVLFEEKYKLVINRNKEKEAKLKGLVCPDVDYIVTHGTGTAYNFDFCDIKNAVEVRPIGGFTIFDWAGVIEDAKALYCVDSCVFNLANQLNLCVNRRYVCLWNKDYLTPRYKADWQKLN